MILLERVFVHLNKQELLQLIVNTADDKKAEDIVVLNMEGISIIADYFVICHGNSERQVQAIAREIRDAVEEKGIFLKKMEGLEEARWVLIEVEDIIVHIFHPEERNYYNLEKLWGDAPRVPLTIGEGQSEL